MDQRSGVMAAVLGASLVSVSATAHSQSATCAAQTQGGTVVTENRGGFNARLAASASGVVVAWVEQRAFANRDFAPSGAANFYYARVLDRATLTARGAAQSLFAQEAPYEIGMGPALGTTSDGRIAAIVCTCVGGSANTLCSASTLAGTPAFGELRPRARQSSVCPSGALSATGVGAQLLVASPFPDAAGIRMYGTSVGALQDVEMDGAIEAPAMAQVGADQAVYARRVNNAIEARLFDVRGNARGRAVTLSSAGAQVGAPFLLSSGDSVIAAFSQRRGRGAWTVHLATWRPGTAPTHVDVNTGSAPAMAPSLAPSSNGCVVLSWTEGSGRNTVARAGRVCNGALDAASVATLSRAGIEAGDSELASDGASVFAVWQEIPPGRGARAELRVARLGCR
ncbi:MAG: hypothetical protein U0269_16045 [Polyangiales bacterium]